MQQVNLAGRGAVLTILAFLALSATAHAQPQIAVSPTSLTESLGPGATATQALTVTNTGTDDLTFTPARGPATTPAGGPDDFGYTWTDSDRPGGPVYQWVDVRATGTHHPLSGIGDVWVDLPFDFPFYGETYDRVNVFADGLVSFLPTYQSPPSNNRPIPYWDEPDLFIAGFWDNLDPSRGGEVYTGTDARGRFVVQYHEVALAGNPTPPGRFTFEIILDPSGTILIQYGPMTGATDSATVGVENATSVWGGSTTGLQVAYDEPYVRDGLAVRVAVGDPWFSVDADTYTLAPGASVDVSVTFSSFALAAGTLTSILVLTSNDPVAPNLDVPVSLTVLEEPNASVSASSLDFGDVYIGAMGVDSLLVTNTGSAPLTVSSITTDGPPFSASLVGAAVIPPGESRTITVTFEPTAAGPEAGTLTVATDDPDEPAVTVALAGAGLLAPDVSVSPASLSASLDVGQTTTRTLTIANEGAGDLAFALVVGGAVDSLYYDAGGDTAGTYGWTPGLAFTVANRFTAEGQFSLTAVRAFLEIERDPTVRVEVYGEGTFGDPTSGPLLRALDVPIPHGPGRMVEISLDTTLTFEDGEDFYVVIGTESEWSPFGADHSSGGRSYYRTPYGPQWYHETGSTTWVIRALTTDAAWLSAEPAAGTVAPGGSLDVTVTLDASVVPGGEYERALVVVSNDPDEPAVTVPVTLDVTGTPDIVLLADALGFGEVYVGETATQTFGVRNLGTGPLTISEIASSDPAFSVAPAGPVTLSDGETLSVEVTFSPAEAGPHEGVITLNSDDPDEPTVAVAVAGEGVDFPSISVSPEALEVQLLAGQTSEQTLTITNGGPGPLAFAFADYAGHTPTGGPDAFGYTWIDSDTPGGPAFDWEDISGTGTPLTLADDASEVVPLPFTFSFYGSDKTSVRVSSNGYLTFGASGSAYDNRPIPHPWLPNDLIAPFWKDLDPSLGGSVHYGTDPHGRFVVQYTDVPRASSPPWTFTCQVILDPGGGILFQYLDMNGPTSSFVTVGIENADGSDGLQIAYNEAYVRNGLAVRIAAVPGWLAVAPATGTVAPGASAEVTVTLDAAGLDDGTYLSALSLTSNDPEASPLLVPVMLDVDGAADVIPLTVALVPEEASVVIPASGGAFTYTATITNNSDRPRTFQAWTMAVRQGAGPSGTLMGPVTVRLGPGQRVRRTLTQHVPAAAPAGAYAYYAYLGTHPNGGVSWTSFPFEKEGTAARTRGATVARAEGTAAEAWPVDYADSGVPAAPGDVWTADDPADASADATEKAAEASTEAALPATFALRAPRPNPFTARATLAYDLPEARHVRLVVYDALGRHVATLVDEERPAGTHEVAWDADGAAAGVYVLHLEAGDFRQSHTMMRVR